MSTRVASVAKTPVGMAVGGSLVAVVVDDEAGLLALRPEWDRLYDAIGAGGGDAFNPFMQWTWTWHWWQTRRSRMPFRQPRYGLHIVVLRDPNGTVRAIVPFAKARWGLGPVSFRALRMFGFGPCTSDLRAPLVWPGWEASAADALAGGLRSPVSTRHDLAVLDGLPESGPLTERLAHRARTEGWSWGPEVPSHTLALPASWEVFRKGFKGHLKKSVRHGYNSLARDGRQWDFEVVDRSDAIAGALTDFFRLHAARAARDIKPRHLNYYARSTDRDALAAVASSAARDGRFVVCRLRVDGRVVAVRLVFIGDGAVYLYDAGADPAWSYYAVATTLTAETLRWAIGRGARWALLGTGEDPSKARWMGRQGAMRRLDVVAPTLAGRALAIAQRLPRTTRARLARALTMATLPLEAIRLESIQLDLLPL